jgi:hypothetical protein
MTCTFRFIFAQCPVKAAKVRLVAAPGVSVAWYCPLSVKEDGTFVANAIGEQPAHHYMMAMSNGYKIYIMDSQHRISLAFEFSGPNDESAVQVAREHAEQNGVEVWKGSCLVAQIAQRAS